MEQNPDNNKTHCPHPIGTFQGIYKNSKGVFIKTKLNIPCGFSKCPVCKKNKLKKVKRRTNNGNFSEHVQRKGFRDNNYSYKFLTLTASGGDYRKETLPNDVYNKMIKDVDKLMRALKKKYGNFHYLRVSQSHKDGYPHLHFLLAGWAISPKGVLKTIRKLWTHKYKNGNVDIEVIKYGIGGALNYIIDYLGSDQVHQFGKNKRIFTSSRGALEPIKKKTWLQFDTRFKGQKLFQLFNKPYEEIILDVYEDEISIVCENKYLIKPQVPYWVANQNTINSLS